MGDITTWSGMNPAQILLLTPEQKAAKTVAPPTDFDSLQENLDDRTSVDSDILMENVLNNIKDQFSRSYFFIDASIQDGQITVYVRNDSDKNFIPKFIDNYSINVVSLNSLPKNQRPITEDYSSDAYWDAVTGS